MSSLVDRYCGICAGLTNPTPDEVTSFPGKLCKCWQRAQQAYRAEAPPVLPTPPVSPAMTSHDFVVWLRGFFTGRSVLPTDPQLEALLRATLDKVKP